MCILDYQNNFFYSHRQVFLRLATKKQTMKKKHLNQTFPGDTQPLTQVKNHQSGRNQKERQAKIYQVSTWKEEKFSASTRWKKKKKKWMVQDISCLCFISEIFSQLSAGAFSDLPVTVTECTKNGSGEWSVHLNNTSSLGQESRVLSLHLLIAFFKRDI